MKVILSNLKKQSFKIYPKIKNIFKTSKFNFSMNNDYQSYQSSIPLLEILEKEISSFSTESNTNTTNSNTNERICNLFISINNNFNLNFPDSDYEIDEISIKINSLLLKITSPLTIDQVNSIVNFSATNDFYSVELSKIVINSMKDVKDKRLSEEDIKKIVSICYYVSIINNDLLKYCLKLVSSFKSFSDFRNVISKSNTSSTIIEYLSYEEFTPSDQEYINSLLKILSFSFKKEVEEDHFHFLISLLKLNYKFNKSNLNLNALYENHLETVISSISFMKKDTFIEIISLYSYFFFSYEQKAYEHKLNTVFFKEAENFVLFSGLESFRLSEIVTILDAFSSLKEGSKELYLEIEKYIGVNIDNLDRSLYTNVLLSFFENKKYRNKFLLLIEKKVIEYVKDFSLDDLSLITALYSLHTSEIYYGYLLKNLEKVFTDNVYHMSSEGLMNVIKAYAGKNNKIIVFIKEFLENKEYKELDKEDISKLLFTIKSLDDMDFSMKTGLDRI